MPLYARGNPAHWWKNRSCGYASRAPRATFVSPFRRLISLGALAALILLLFGVWYATRPQRISRLAEALLSNLLGGSVSVKTGHLSLSGTLLLSNVLVQTPAGAGGTGGGGAVDSHPLPLFSAEQIEARFDWVSLFAGELRASQLTAIRPTLYLIEDKQADRWNYEMVRRSGAQTQPGGGAAAGGPSRVALPVIVLRDARVQWGEFANGHLTQSARAVIDGQLSPTAADPFTYRFQLVQQPGEANAAESPAGNAPVTVTGTWDMVNNRFTAAAQEIVLSDALRDILPRQVRDWWNEHHLRGRFSQLWVSFDNETGTFVGADLDRVSMEMQATPRSDGITYPVNLSDIRGSLRFGLKNASVDANIRGLLLGYNFEATGSVAGSAPDSPLDMHIRFPAAVLGDDYPPLFMAFPESQDLIQRTAPHGRFDVTLGIKRIGGTRDLHLDGNIYCNDARMRFGPFPFPLDHVKGHVRFDENTVTFDNVTATADENLIHISGTTGTTPANTAIDFRVWADDAIFDDRLAACLPGDFKAIWDQFVLQARGSFNCLVKRSPNNRGAPDVHVDLNLSDGHGYPRAFPYRFSHAHGQLVLTGDQSFVNGLTVACGADGSGTIRIDGIIHHPGGNVRNLMPDLRVTANLPIDTTLLDALPEEYTARVRGFEFGGRFGFQGIFQRIAATEEQAKRGQDAPINVAGNITVQQGTIRSHDGNIDLRELTAAAQLNGRHLDLQNAAAKLMNTMQLSASGTADLAKPSAHLTIGAHGRDVLLPAAAPGILPQSMRETWNAFKPQGKIDVDANAVVSAGLEAGATTSPATAPAGDAFPGISVEDYSCTLEPKGISVSHASWPAGIDDIQGRILLAPGKIAFQQLTAASGPVSLRCDGSYRTDTGQCSLRATATSDGLPGPWMTKLPKPVAAFLSDHKAAGQFRLSVDRLERDDSAKPWTFDADLAVRNLTTDKSLSIAAERLLLSTSGTWRPAGFDFTGQLNGTNVGFSGKTLDTLHAAVATDSTRQTLNISEIDGKVAGGEVQGSVTVRFAGAPAGAATSPAGAANHTDAGYEANLVLHDADLGRLALPKTASDEERKRIGDGRVSASLAVQENFGEHPDRTGRGELVIQDGKIYNVPLAMGLMQLVTLRLPVEHAFDHASMSYYLRDNKVTFEKILLESDSIDLAGQGSMSLKDMGLDLTFVTESPDKVELPLISPLINEIRAQLLELAVTGTIDNPKITPVPLSPLSAPLLSLLPHKKVSSP